MPQSARNAVTRSVMAEISSCLAVSSAVKAVITAIRLQSSRGWQRVVGLRAAGLEQLHPREQPRQERRVDRPQTFRTVRIAWRWRTGTPAPPPAAWILPQQPALLVNYQRQREPRLEKCVVGQECRLRQHLRLG